MLFYANTIVQTEIIKVDQTILTFFTNISYFTNKFNMFQLEFYLYSGGVGKKEFCPAAARDGANPNSFCIF